MAYFPNGTAGDEYSSHYCERCVHDLEPEKTGGCRVLLLHLVHNYDQCRDTPEGKLVKGVLDILIPRSKDGLDNEQCTMFVEAK